VADGNAGWAAAWFHIRAMSQPTARRSLLSRIAERLTAIDPAVVLVLLIALLAIGVGGMLLSSSNGPETAAITPGPPTSQPPTGAASPAGGQASPTPAAGQTSGPGQTSTPSPTPSGPPTPPVTPTPSPIPTPTPVPTPTSLPPSELTGYVWPVVNARISSPFGTRSDGFVVIDGQNAHDGIDLATWCGDRIRAAHDGTVLYVGRKFDPYLGYSQPLGDFYARIGNLNTLPIVIVIDDGNGYRSVYAHEEALKVKAGDVVHAGETIGYEGATGHATGCHLHYGLIRMDGDWQPVARQFVNLYPPFVRERVDPLLVLPLHDPDAATRFLNQYPQPSVPGLPFDPPPGP
jgi:murein DD-endopeptidase MepM/ murein hydrolase activator NlpD